MARHGVENLPSLLEYATSQEDNAIFDLNESLEIVMMKTCHDRDTLCNLKNVATVIFDMVNAHVRWKTGLSPTTICGVLYMASDALTTGCTLLRYVPKGHFRLSDVQKTTMDTIAIPYKRALTHSALFDLLKIHGTLLDLLIIITYLNRMSSDFNRQLSESSIIVGATSLDVAVGNSDVVIQNVSNILRAEHSYDRFCAEIIKNWRPL